MGVKSCRGVIPKIPTHDQAVFVQWRVTIPPPSLLSHLVPFSAGPWPLWASGRADHTKNSLPAHAGQRCSGWGWVQVHFTHSAGRVSTSFTSCTPVLGGCFFPVDSSNMHMIFAKLFTLLLQNSSPYYHQILYPITNKFFAILPPSSFSY